MTVEITPAVLSDYEALAGFLSGSGELKPADRQFWLSRFRLWWDENPAFDSGLPRGWTLRDEGSIVGFIGNLPGRFQLAGQDTRVFGVTTWYVAPKYRDRSLELLMRQTESAKDTLLFDATPTDLVARVLENMGFKPLPAMGPNESFLAFDFGRCLASRILGSSTSSVIWRVAGLPLAALQTVRLRLSPGSSIELWEPAEIGATFDELWERTRGRWANTNVRNAAAIRWQLADQDVPKKIAAFRRGGRLAGYAIFKSTRRRDLPALDCADFWCEPESEDAGLAAAVLFARSYGKKNNFALATFPHFNAAHGARLRRLGLFNFPFAPRRALVLGPDRLTSRIKAENSWFTGLQGDAGTSP